MNGTVGDLSAQGTIDVWVILGINYYGEKLVQRGNLWLGRDIVERNLFLIIYGLVKSVN